MLGFTCGKRDWHVYRRHISFGDKINFGYWTLGRTKSFPCLSRATLQCAQVSTRCHPANMDVIVGGQNGGCEVDAWRANQVRRVFRYLFSTVYCRIQFPKTMTGSQMLRAALWVSSLSREAFLKTSIVCDKLLRGLGRGAAQGRSLPLLLWREEDQEGAACPFFLNLFLSSLSEFGTPCVFLSFILSVDWEVTARPVGNLLRDLCWASVERSQHHQRRLLFSFSPSMRS